MANTTFKLGGVPVILTDFSTVAKCIANPNFLLTFATNNEPKKPYVHMRYADYPDSVTIKRMGLVELNSQDLVDYYKENPNAK
jgi:hypothetical protein